MASNNSTLRTVIIKPGERVIIPQDAVVQSIVTDGAIDVTSSCNNLPPVSTYRCGYFYILMDKDDNPGHSMDEESTYITKLIVGRNEYHINRRVVASGDGTQSVIQTAEVLNTHVPDQSLFSFTRIQGEQLNARQGVYIYFKTIDSLFTTVELEVDNRGSKAYYKGYVVECNMYEFGVDESIKDEILGPES